MALHYTNILLAWTAENLQGNEDSIYHIFHNHLACFAPPRQPTTILNNFTSISNYIEYLRQVIIFYFVHITSIFYMHILVFLVFSSAWESWNLPKPFGIVASSWFMQNKLLLDSCKTEREKKLREREREIGLIIIS